MHVYIEKILAWEIFDSLGNLAIEADVILSDQRSLKINRAYYLAAQF